MAEEKMEITRELWVLLVRALDGDADARQESQHQLIATAPSWWDEDLEVPPRPIATVIPLSRRAGR